MRSSVHLVSIGGVRNGYRILVGKYNIQLGSKHLWQNSVKVEVREIEKFDFFTAAINKIMIFWIMLLCDLADGY